MTPHEPALQAPEGGVVMDLIARLEAATGPDRELDAWILWLTSNAREDRRAALNLKADAYTASLDAAKSRIPKGHAWAAGDCSSDNGPWACVTRNEDGADFYATAATVPSALCIACLKARATLPAPTRGAAQAPVSHV